MRSFSTSSVFLVGLLLSSYLSLAQHVVRGTVKDETGLGLPGVNIVLKGTNIGVSSDFDGNYEVSVKQNETVNNSFTLEYSFIGYSTFEQTFVYSAGKQEVYDLNLQPDAEVLEDVVVIGYGTQKKEDKTGSVFSVTADDIQVVALQDPIEGIQGKVPGVTIRKSGSDPNGGFDVKIRGASGLSSGTNPLYVVDGVVGVDPTTIAAEDIASFNVLKDASSAAIYGSRGANGVILITTKRGKEGGSQVDYNGYVTFDQVSRRSRLDLMSADEFRAYGDAIGKPVRDLGYDTDWQEEIYRTGFTQNHNVALSGGSQLGTYRASVTHNDMEGVIKTSGKTRTIMRLNAETKALNERVTLSMNLANTIEHNDYVNYGSSGADGTLFQAFQRNPTLPVYNEDGSFYQDPTQPVNNYSNPVAILNDVQNERDAKRLLANLKADVEITKALKFTMSGSYTRDDAETFYFEPAANGPLNGEGFGKREYSNNANKLFETFLSYNKTFNLHNINAVAGYSYQEFAWDGFRAQGKNPASDFTKAHDLASLARVVPGDVASWKGESKLISGFARFAYNFDHKYFVTGTLRRDGSSKFGANHEWGLFPSASLAWNMKNENFLEDVDQINQMKLRFGWGQTGNQEIPTYADIALFGVTGYTLDPVTNQYTVNYGALQNANPNLKWEVNTEMNIGVDFGLFQNRLSGSVDYFNKKTTDLIYNYTVPVPPNLVDNTLANAGAIDISGLEVMLTGFIVDNENFKWNSSATFTQAKMIVSSLGNEEFPAVDKVLEGYLQEPLGFGTATQIMREGLERGTFYGPKFAGVDARTGKFLYHTSDEGVFKTIDRIEDKDKQILGQALPDFEIGWSNSLDIYKNWDVNFTFRGMFGHDILNATKMVFGNPSYFPTRNVLNSAPANTLLTGPSDFSDYFLEKGNFFRLENITVGYNVNTKNSKWIKKARFYVAGNNLWTISNYSGIDPSTVGIDIFNIYPKSSSATFGLNVSF